MRIFFFGWVVVFVTGSIACHPSFGAEPKAAPVAPALPLPEAIAQADQRAREAEARGDIAALVAALNDEGDAQLRAHDFDRAEKLRLRVLQLQEQHAGKNSLAVADALLNLGWFYGNMARYERAQDDFDRCLDLRQRLLGQDAAPVAEVYNALGVLEENRSNFTLAEAFYRQALAIQEKALGAQNTTTANTWNNLATLYWITGDYAQAQTYFSQALAVREKILGPNSLEVATTLHNLALLDASLGDCDDAESMFQRALQIRQTRLGPDHPLTITTLSKLGLLYVQEGDDAKAEPLLVKTVEVREKIYPVAHPDVAQSLSQLGQLYDRRKLYDKAEPLLLRALDIRRKTLGAEDPELAASLACLARHDHAQGRMAEALPLYEEALKIDDEALGRDHPETQAIASDLAYLKIEMGKPSEAAELARQVAEAQQNALNGVFTFTQERQRMDFAKTMEPCDLPAALGNADLLAQVVLRTKGVVLDSLLEDEATTRAARDPDVRTWIENQRLLQARLSQGQEDASGAELSPAAIADRKKMEKEERDLEANLAAKGIGSGKTRRALGTDVSEVRDAVPEDAALVEYVVYNRYVGRLGYERAYGAVILTHDGPPHWVALGPAAELEARVKIYQKYVRRRVHETVLAGVLQELYQSLAQPVVATLPRNVHRLIISPDGDLNFVSFATLLDGQQRFFGSDFDLNFVSSGRDLLRKKEDAPAKRNLVIFADPDYAHLPRAITEVKGRASLRADDLLAPLPGTEKEATFLQTVAESDGIGFQLYRGAEATEARLAAVNSPYILHLATHGLYLSTDDVPTLAANLGQSDGVKTTAAEPMQRSLLALAGGAVTLRDWKRGVFPPPDNDGLLTAQEVAGLNLDRTWLVVLSACDTGSGEARAGEGVLGLRRGFAEAGAENLLMTLWTVDDAETADLMEAFYREALRSGDAPGALARVQRASLESIRQKSGLSEAVRQAGPFILNY